MKKVKEAARKSETMLVPVTRAMRREIERRAHRERVPLAEICRRAFAVYLGEDAKGGGEAAKG